MENGLHDWPEGRIGIFSYFKSFSTEKLRYLHLQSLINFNLPFQYKVVTDNCEHAFWEECEDQTKKVPFHVSCKLKAYPLGVSIFT